LRQSGSAGFTGFSYSYRINDEKTHLILAGHTHRGQMFPGNLFTRAMLAMDYGHYQINQNNTHVIVTQGVGTWMMPMRIGSNNEIVSIDLIGSP